jgi:photosystem II stability/assembly factor-like uncharacterized protein
MKRRAWLLMLALALIGCGALDAQWQIENSGTTADLRGIDNVGGGVAWASGTNGTVLRTEDGGYMCQPCAIPPDAAKLDFRGVQAFDANTAIVMSSGTGDQSRLYKTTDGCQTWKLVFTNPDKDGFWDAIQFHNRIGGWLLGDPVHGHFQLWETISGGTHWSRVSESMTPRADARLSGVFAASNSSMSLFPSGRFPEFASGGTVGARFYHIEASDVCIGSCPKPTWKAIDTPIQGGTMSAGIFSLFMRRWSNGVIVGGDYKKPDESSGTAACTVDAGDHWTPAQTLPHGYRSAVAYDESTSTWITVGPNGTDVSTDDGKNWRAVHPDAAMHEAADADRNWNALSLPYVVGPKGRIGKLGRSGF